MLDLLISTNPVRPNKVQDKQYKGKDELYHVDMARYYLSASTNPTIRDFQTKCMIDWAFYQGNQWIFNDDLESFLTDESGEVRNRIRFVLDICSPKIRQYIGNIIRVERCAVENAISAAGTFITSFALITDIVEENK